MGQYRNILVIADPERPGSAALRRAGALAKASGATLHLRAFSHHAGIAALGLVQREVAELARKELMREQYDWLEREADTLRAGDVEVRVDVAWGHPLHEKIVAEIVTLAPDLVVKDVKSLPAVRRLLFAPLDWHLVRMCPAPLLMVNRGAHLKPRRLIAAVDTAFETPETAGLNDDIVRAALDLALQCDAQVDIVHAFEGLPAVPRGPLEGATSLSEDVYREFRDARRAGFDAFADRQGVPRERRHFLDGLADLAISGLANDTGADVVVLGSVMRTGLERLLVGSTAERLLDSLACDVLVLKPRNFAAELARHYGLTRAAA